MASAEFSRARRGTASREGLPDGEPESPSDNRPTQFSLLAALSMFAGPILGDLWGPILQRQHYREEVSGELKKPCPVKMITISVDPRDAQNLESSYANRAQRRC